MDGFIVVDKPVGLTSHDVVSAVRRIAGLRKVGHTGTLDPFATGVLPVALGEGTKAIPFLDESVKEYHAVMCIGAATDTQDFTGTIIGQAEWQEISPAVIESAIASFIGKGKQVPPMFSALKRNGVPLYKLARKGEEVHRESRDIEVHSLVIDRLEPPEVAFTVRCSRGVYVRTLAHDIGEALGCGAHLTVLRRSASGPFSLNTAVSLEALATARDEGRLNGLLVSCSAALDHMRSLLLTAEGVMRVRRGQAPRDADVDSVPDEVFGPGEKVRLCHDGVLVAVAESELANPHSNGNNLRLLRVFNEV